MPKINDATIRTAAGDAGFAVEQAVLRGRWRLLDQERQLGFPSDRANAFS
jgi:hypothetical protein